MSAVLFHLSDQEKEDAVRTLVERSSPRQEFFLMIVLSVAMATFGLLIANPVVIIGSMLIAPLLSPILSAALAIVISDAALLRRSFGVIIKSFGLGVVVASAIALFFGVPEINGEIMQRAAPSLAFFGIAVIAGVAASIASVRTYLEEMLSGVAIAVSLIPPIAVAGIGLARFEWSLMSGAFLLFAMNLAGILFASMIVFSLSRFYDSRREASQALKEDEKEIQKKKEAAENAEA